MVFLVTKRTKGKVFQIVVLVVIYSIFEDFDTNDINSLSHQKSIILQYQIQESFIVDGFSCN